MTERTRPLAGWIISELGIVTLAVVILSSDDLDASQMVGLLIALNAYNILAAIRWLRRTLGEPRIPRD